MKYSSKRKIIAVPSGLKAKGTITFKIFLVVFPFVFFSSAERLFRHYFNTCCHSSTHCCVQEDRSWNHRSLTLINWKFSPTASLKMDLSSFQNRDFFPVFDSFILYWEKLQYKQDAFPLASRLQFLNGVFYSLWGGRCSEGLLHGSALALFKTVSLQLLPRFCSFCICQEIKASSGWFVSCLNVFNCIQCFHHIPGQQSGYWNCISS